MFTLQVDGGATDEEVDVGDGGTTGKLTISAGTNLSPGEDHTVGEIAGTGTDLNDYVSSITCVMRGTNSVIAEGSGSGPLTVNVQPDDDIVCTITNVRRSYIQIAKETDPDGDSATFDFVGDIVDTLGDGDTSAPVEVSPGEYTVTELVPDGWDLTDITCDDANSTGNKDTATATFNVEPGETVTCTFTNTKDGNIIIGKVTNPAGDSRRFDFTTDYGPDFSLGDGETNDSGGLSPGNYSVSEDLPPGWTLTSSTCDNNDTPDNITLDAGVTISCTFTNTLADVRISITPSAVNAVGDSHTFTVTVEQTTDRVNWTPVEGLNPDVTITPEPTSKTDNCATTGTDANGQCTVVISSDTAAQFVATAEVTVNVLGLDIHRQTGTSANSGTDDAVKQYADLRISITPGSATNSVGEPHTFTVKVEQNDGQGGGWQPVQGATPIVTVVPQPTTITDNCASLGTDANGQCTVVISSDRPARYSVSAQVTVEVGGVEITRSTRRDALNIDAGGTGNAIKVYVPKKYIILTPSYLVTRVYEGRLSGEGSIACYWITLSTAPDGNVVIDVDPDNKLKEIVISPRQITLTAANWDSLTLAERSNFLCVRAVNDAIDEAENVECGDKSADLTTDTRPYGEECGDHKEFAEHQVNAASTATGYNRLTPWINETLTFLGRPDENYLEALIVDDDGAAVRITESYAVSDLDEDGTPTNLACYWVTLASAPASNETVTVIATAVGNVNVQPGAVYLTSTNWDALGAASNRLCLTPRNNDVIDTTGAYSAPKDAAIYGSGADVAGTVAGDYLAFVNHTASSDLSGSPYAGNAAPFTKNGPEVGGDNTPSQVDVLMRDDDKAGVIFTPNQYNVLEGGVLTLAAQLSSRPRNDVTVTVALVNEAAAAGGTASAAPTAGMTFTPATWDTAQTVAIPLGDNDTADGLRRLVVRHSTSSADPAYNGLTDAAAARVTVVDNEGAHVFVLANVVAVAEGGAGASYDVVLTSRPSSPVTLNIVPDAQATVAPQSLLFTGANWNQAQSVTVQAVDDAIDDDEGAGIIRHVVAESGADYQGVVGGDLSVTVADNDTAGIAVDAPAQTDLAEGAHTTYGVRLTSAPTAPVTVFIVTDGRTAPDTTTLTFDAQNWSTPQPVALAAVDDDVDAWLDVRSAVVNHVALSDDANYAGLEAAELALAVADNDTARLVVSTQRLNVPGDGTATYAVSLATRPMADVVVSLDTGGGLMVDAACDSDDEAPACVRFTPDDWNVARPIAVTGTADGRTWISHTVASDDLKYDGLHAPGVTVLVGDNAGGFDVFLPFTARE